MPLQRHLHQSKESCINESIDAQNLNLNKKGKEEVNGEEIKPKIEKTNRRLRRKNKDSDTTRVFNKFYRIGSSFKCDRRTKPKELPSTVRNHIDLYKRKCRRTYDLKDAFKPVQDLEQELAEDWQTTNLERGKYDRTYTPRIEFDNKFGELSEVEDIVTDCSESEEHLKRDKEVQEEEIRENRLEKSIRIRDGGTGNEGADTEKPIGKKTSSLVKKVDSEGRQRDPDDSREMKPDKERNSTEQGSAKAKKERRKWHFWKRHKNKGEGVKDKSTSNKNILQEKRGANVECEDEVLFQRLYERIMKKIETEKQSAIANVEKYSKYKLICDDLMKTMSKVNISATDRRGAEPGQRKMPTGNGQVECRTPMSMSTSDCIGRERSKTGREADNENSRRKRIETKNSSGNDSADGKCEENRRLSDQSRNDEFSNKRCKDGDGIGKCGKERNESRQRVGRTLNNSFKVEGNGTKRCLGDSSKSSKRNMMDSCIGFKKSGCQQETDKCSKFNRHANGESLLSRKVRDFGSSSDSSDCDSETDGSSEDSSSEYADDSSEECSDHDDTSSEESSDSDVEYTAGRDNTRGHNDSHDPSTPVLTRVKSMERQAPPSTGDGYTNVKSDNDRFGNRKLNGGNERITRNVQNRKNDRYGNDASFKRMAVEPCPQDGHEFENQTLQMKNRKICRERAMNMKSKQFEDDIPSRVAKPTVKEDVSLRKKDKFDTKENKAMPGKKKKKSCKQKSREKKIRKYLEYIEKNIELLGSDSRIHLVKNYDLDNRLKVLSNRKLSPKSSGHRSVEIRQGSKSRQNVKKFEKNSVMVDERRDYAANEVLKENDLEKVKVERKRRKPYRKKSREKMLNKSSEYVENETSSDFKGRANGRKVPERKFDSQDLFIKTKKEKKAKKMGRKERSQQKKLWKCLETIEKSRHLMKDNVLCDIKTEKMDRATSYEDMRDEGSNICMDDAAVKPSQPQIYEEIRRRKCTDSRPEDFDKVNKIASKRIIDKREDYIIRDRKRCEKMYCGAKRNNNDKMEDSDSESEDEEEVVHKRKCVEDRVRPKRCGYGLKLKPRLDDSTSVLSRVKMGRRNSSESSSDSDYDAKRNNQRKNDMLTGGRDKCSLRDREKQTDRRLNCTNDTRPMSHERHHRGRMDCAVGNVKEETSKDINRERLRRKANRPNEEAKGRCVMDEKIERAILIKNGRSFCQKEIKQREKDRTEVLEISRTNPRQNIQDNSLNDSTGNGRKSPSTITIRNGSSCDRLRAKQSNKTFQDDVQSKSPVKKNDDNKRGVKDYKIPYKKETDKNVKPVNYSSDKYYRKDNRGRPYVDCPVCDNRKTFSGRGRREEGCRSVRSDSDDRKADRSVDSVPTKDSNDARKRIDQACDVRRFKIYEFPSQNILFANKNSIERNGTDIEKTLKEYSDFVKRTDVVKESYSGGRFKRHSIDGRIDRRSKDILIVVYSRCNSSGKRLSDDLQIKDDSELQGLLKTTFDNDCHLHSTNDGSDCSPADVESGKERSDDDIEAYLRTRFELSRSEVSFKRIDRFNRKRHPENSARPSADKNPSNPPIRNNITYKIFKFIDKRMDKKMSEADKKIKTISRKHKMNDEDKSKQILNVKTNDKLFLKWIENARNQKLKKIRYRKKRKVEELGTKDQFSSLVRSDRQKESKPAELKCDDQPTAVRKKMNRKIDAPFGPNVDEDLVKISKEDCCRLEDEGVHCSLVKNDEQCKKYNEFIGEEHLLKNNYEGRRDDAKFCNKEFDIDQVDDRMRDSGANLIDILNNPISEKSRSVHSPSSNRINSCARLEELECQVTQDSSGNNRIKEENIGNNNLELKENGVSSNIVDRAADAEVETVCRLWIDGGLGKSVRDEVNVGYFNQVELNENLGNFENLNGCHSEKKQPGGDNILNLSQCGESNIESGVCKNLAIVSKSNKNKAVKLNEKYQFYRLFNMPPKNNDGESTDSDGIRPENKRNKKRCRTKRDLKKGRSKIRNGPLDLSSQYDDSEHETSDSDRDGGKAPENTTRSGAALKKVLSAETNYRENEVRSATWDAAEPKRNTGQSDVKEIITRNIENVSSIGETSSKLDVITDKLKINADTDELNNGSEVVRDSGGRKDTIKRTDKGTIDKSGDRETKKMMMMDRIKKRLESKACDDLTTGIEYFKKISQEFISVYKLPKIRNDFPHGRRHFHWGVKLKVNQCYLNTDNVNFDDVRRGW